MSPGEGKEPEVQGIKQNPPSGVECVISLSDRPETSRAHCPVPWRLIIASKKIKGIIASKNVRVRKGRGI